MQVCTVACGKTAVIASGNPFSPSTTAISTSSTPRFFSSFMTRRQNLAPSFCSSQRPKISLVPSARTPSAICTALLRTRPSSRIFTRGVEENQWVGRLQRPGLPGGNLLQHRVGHCADQIGRHVDAEEIAQMANNLTRAHAARVHRDDLVIETRKPALVLGDQLRIEAGLAVAWHLQLHLAGVGDDCLLAIAVAPVTELLAG